MNRQILADSFSTLALEEGFIVLRIDDDDDFMITYRMNRLKELKHENSLPIFGKVLLLNTLNFVHSIEIEHPDIIVIKFNQCRLSYFYSVTKLNPVGSFMTI
jgi:hypothetical protein